MSPTRWPYPQDLSDELRAGPLALHVDAFERHLHDWQYARKRSGPPSGARDGTSTLPAAR